MSADHLMADPREPEWPTKEEELRAIALITDHRIGLHYVDQDCLVCWQLGRVKP